MIWMLIILSISFIVFALIISQALINGIGPVPSGVKVKNRLLTMIPPLSEGPIFELGSGWGTLAFALARRFPDHRIVAYENSAVPYIFSRFLNVFYGYKNLRFCYEDFFHASLHDASLVVCYLYPDAMTKLKEKFSQELPHSCYVISHTFALPQWTPILLDEASDMYHTKIYLYHVNNSVI